MSFGSLAGANLQGAYLRGADLGSADFREAVLRGAVLAGADLRGADLRSAVFASAELGGAQLEGATLFGGAAGNLKQGLEGYRGVLERTDQPELADEFLAFMLSDGFQSVIPTTNWMYPAVKPSAGLPEGFETLITPDPALSFTSEEVFANRRAWIDEWLNALSR